MTPVGLFGVFIIKALVFGVIAFFRASKSGSKVSIFVGTSINFPS